MAIAEVDTTDKWQRATLGVAAIGDRHDLVEVVPAKVSQWIEGVPTVNLIRIEKECW